MNIYDKYGKEKKLILKHIKWFFTDCKNPKDNLMNFTDLLRSWIINRTHIIKFTNNSNRSCVQHIDRAEMRRLLFEYMEKEILKRREN
jgi:hypothetical protein